MQNKSQTVSVSSESLQRGHEARDPHLRNALIVVASVGLMLLVGLASGGILIHAFSKNHPLQNMQPFGIISEPDLKPLEQFPKPNLQIDDDHAQRTILYDQQNEKLKTYGWMDRSNGIVRIPIVRAMDLILQRGLPTRTNGISQTDGSPLQLIQERANQP
jgi:hypothetical protein